jgi:hypothetical protein
MYTESKYRTIKQRRKNQKSDIYPWTLPIVGNIIDSINYH